MNPSLCWNWIVCVVLKPKAENCSDNFMQLLQALKEVEETRHLTTFEHLWTKNWFSYLEEALIFTFGCSASPKVAVTQIHLTTFEHLWTKNWFSYLEEALIFTFGCSASPKVAVTQIHLTTFEHLWTKNWFSYLEEALIFTFGCSASPKVAVTQIRQSFDFPVDVFICFYFFFCGGHHFKT